MTLELAMRLPEVVHLAEKYIEIWTSKHAEFEFDGSHYVQIGKVEETYDDDVFMFEAINIDRVIIYEKYEDSATMEDIGIIFPVENMAIKRGENIPYDGSSYAEGIIFNAVALEERIKDEIKKEVA